MAQEQQTFLAYLVVLAGAGITGALGWLWRNTMGRISSLEKEKVSSKEFSEYTQRADKSREELRETMETHRKETRDNVIGIHKKIEDLGSHVDKKLDRLADLIRESR